MPYTAPETADVVPEYRPSALRNIMGQSWFPYLAFFIGLAAFALVAAVSEFVLKKRELHRLHQQILAAVPVTGQRNAPVQVLEFSDLGCAFCSEQYFELRQALRPLIEQGKVAVFLVNVQKLGDEGGVGSRFEFCVARQDPDHHAPFLETVFRHNRDLVGQGFLEKQYLQSGGQRLKQVQACQNSTDAQQYRLLQKNFVDRLKVMGVSVRHGDVAVQTRLLNDVRDLERVVAAALEAQGKVQGAALKSTRPLY